MYPMYDWLKDLFPVNRSLTGSGVIKTLEYLSEICPEITPRSFTSGTQVNDWFIPQIWEIESGWIQHVETGQVFCNFDDCNLHIVGYSTSVDMIVDRDELLNNIFSEPLLPDAIPYITSYYNRSWGFCCADTVKSKLPAGKYRAFIDSKHFDGEMWIGEAILKGDADREIFFSTYICHPSMANNELSGPVLQTALLKYVSEFYPKPHYTYKFVFVPETIGSIAYLSQNLATLKQNVCCGFVLSCVGDSLNYSHVESRSGDTLADQALDAAISGKSNHKKFTYLSRGSDERQYCAPGVDLPLCGFCRTKYGEYPEYHTSLDDLDFVSSDGLQGSFDVMKSIIDAFELGIFPLTSVIGEPELGRRGLYPTIGQKDNSGAVRARLDTLAYADGKSSVFDICLKIKQPLSTVLSELEILKEHDLVNCYHTAQSVK